MNVLILLAALVPLCYGQGGGHEYVDTQVAAHLMWLDSDANKDGNLTLQELEAVFFKYDVNHDNRVSRHEYTDYLQLHSPELLDLGHHLYDIYDVDGDHHLDLHDYDNFYKLMDGDGDGQVTENDFVSYWRKLLDDNSHLHPMPAGK